MKESKIVFAAVVAFTDVSTADGRMLTTPEGFHCPVRYGFPLPIMWTPPNQNGKVRQTIRVGMIEQAYVVDRRVITFGRLDGTEEIRRDLLPMLQDGSRFLEIDVTAADVSYDLNFDPLTSEQTGPVIFKDWILRSAFVGPGGVWPLPPVQIEEVPEES